MKIKKENEITKKKGRREALKRMANLMIGAVGVAAFPRISSSNECIKYTKYSSYSDYSEYSEYSEYSSTSNYDSYYSDYSDSYDRSYNNYNDFSGYNKYGSIVYLKRS
jgi:hypothetical protein